MFSENGVQFVDIPITDDSIEEGNEFFTVTLSVDSQPQNVIVLQPDSKATVLIMDGDGKYVYKSVTFHFNCLGIIFVQLDNFNV